LTRTVLVSCFMAALWAGSFAAAQPELPLHWFTERLPLSDGNAISFCIDPRDPGHVVDAAIAEAIADALLVDVRLHVVDRPLQSEDDFEDLYFELVEYCAVYVGFRLYSETYPEWIITTRGFYESRFVLVTADPAWSTLDDIPLDVPIGVVQGTLGDIRFLMSNNAQTVDRRRPRVPLGLPHLAFDALLAGNVGALLVWEPWWWWLGQEREDVAALHVVEAPSISEPGTEVGAVLLSNRTFIRTQVDEAIGALIADGTIAAILERFEYPGLVR
jgi:hypothetical protein